MRTRQVRKNTLRRREEISPMVLIGQDRDRDEVEKQQ